MLNLSKALSWWRHASQGAPAASRHRLKAIGLVLAWLTLMTDSAPGTAQRAPVSTSASGAGESSRRDPDPTQTPSGAFHGFRQDVDAFRRDLIASGYHPQTEARVVAYHAVREAYTRGVPPALVFGVMKQETESFNVDALSKVGARGLMQIMPQWRDGLAKLFGSDLSNPITNVRYGVYVLAHFAREERGDWEATLRRYSGNATNYPLKVMRHIRRSGHNLCGATSLDDCVGLALWERFRFAPGAPHRRASQTAMRPNVRTPVRRAETRGHSQVDPTDDLPKSRIVWSRPTRRL